MHSPVSNAPTIGSRIALYAKLWHFDGCGQFTLDIFVQMRENAQVCDQRRVIDGGDVSLRFVDTSLGSCPARFEVIARGASNTFLIPAENVQTRFVSFGSKHRPRAFKSIL